MVTANKVDCRGHEIPDRGLKEQLLKLKNQNQNPTADDQPLSGDWNSVFPFLLG